MSDSPSIHLASTADDQPPSAEQLAALDIAVNGLRRDNPMASAATPFVPWQVRGFLGLLVVVAVCAVLWTSGTVVVLCLTATAFYLISMLDRVFLFVRGLDERTILRVSDADARAQPGRRPARLHGAGSHLQGAVGDPRAGRRSPRSSTRRASST